MALLERRDERRLVAEAAVVLSERRDQLARALLEATRALENLHAECDVALAQARTAFRRAVLRHGFYGLAPRAARTRAAQAAWGQVNYLGVSLIEALPAASLEEGEPEDPGGSIEYAGALRAMVRLMVAIESLAPAENNVRRLTDTFRRTQRRVNALEHVLLPEIHADIRRIEDAMDEIERDALVRTRRAGRSVKGEG